MLILQMRTPWLMLSESIARFFAGRVDSRFPVVASIHETAGPSDFAGRLQVFLAPGGYGMSMFSVLVPAKPVLARQGRAEQELEVPQERTWVSLVRRHHSGQGSD